MHKSKIIIILLFLITILVCNGQRISIGDVIPGNTIKPMHTNLIGGQTVTFIEDKFTIKMSKTDILKELKSDSINNDTSFKLIYKIVISYLSSKNNFTFKYIWTKADFDSISWFDIKALGNENLTKKILKGHVYSLIENGQFEIYENGKQIKSYYFKQIETQYGSFGKGVFSSKNRLIWLCPPFID